ncbi:orotidine 5'-phosphate decarboxylase [Candidatus Woesearchaeota archaeon]|nr:orotidine 5'-phosphate decarboxylase [Candidatus Woesearchaeota archaeon]
MSIIKYQKSIIPACDVATLEELRDLVKATHDVPGVGGYKIGFELGLPFSIPKVVETIREFTDLPIIYDHQKAGTDIPATGKKFADAVRGVDAVIFFPQAGPVTLEAWIKAAQEAGLGVIVGGEMTHKGYLETEGGYLRAGAPEEIYKLAASLGVKDFVVPGNRPERIGIYKKLLVGMGVEPVFYSPGLITQGGDIAEGAKAAGRFWHAIIGSGIYEKGTVEAMKEATRSYASQLK